MTTLFRNKLITGLLIKKTKFILNLIVALFIIFYSTACDSNLNTKSNISDLKNEYGILEHDSTYTCLINVCTIVPHEYIFNNGTYQDADCIKLYIDKEKNEAPDAIIDLISNDYATQTISIPYGKHHVRLEICLNNTDGFFSKCLLCVSSIITCLGHDFFYDTIYNSENESCTKSIFNAEFDIDSKFLKEPEYDYYQLCIDMDYTFNEYNN